MDDEERERIEKRRAQDEKQRLKMEKKKRKEARARRKAEASRERVIESTGETIAKDRDSKSQKTGESDTSSQKGNREESRRTLVRKKSVPILPSQNKGKGKEKEKKIDDDESERRGRSRERRSSPERPTRSASVNIIDTDSDSLPPDPHWDPSLTEKPDDMVFLDPQDDVNVALYPLQEIRFDTQESPLTPDWTTFDQNIQEFTSERDAIVQTRDDLIHLIQVDEWESYRMRTLVVGLTQSPKALADALEQTKNDYPLREARITSMVTLVKEKIQNTFQEVKTHFMDTVFEKLDTLQLGTRVFFAKEDLVSAVIVERVLKLLHEQAVIHSLDDALKEHGTLVLDNVRMTVQEDAVMKRPFIKFTLEEPPIRQDPPELPNEQRTTYDPKVLEKYFKNKLNVLETQTTQIQHMGNSPWWDAMHSQMMVTRGHTVETINGILQRVEQRNPLSKFKGFWSNDMGPYVQGLVARFTVLENFRRTLALSRMIIIGVHVKQEMDAYMNAMRETMNATRDLLLQHAVAVQTKLKAETKRVSEGAGEDALSIRRSWQAELEKLRKARRTLKFTEPALQTQWEMIQAESDAEINHPMKNMEGTLADARREFEAKVTEMKAFFDTQAASATAAIRPTVSPSRISPAGSNRPPASNPSSSNLPRTLPPAYPPSLSPQQRLPNPSPVPPSPNIAPTPPPNVLPNTVPSPTPAPSVPSVPVSPPNPIPQPNQPSTSSGSNPRHGSQPSSSSPPPNAVPSGPVSPPTPVPRQQSSSSSSSGTNPSRRNQTSPSSSNGPPSGPAPAPGGGPPARAIGPPVNINEMIDTRMSEILNQFKLDLEHEGAALDGFIGESVANGRRTLTSRVMAIDKKREYVVLEPNTPGKHKERRDDLHKDIDQIRTVALGQYTDLANDYLERSKAWMTESESRMKSGLDSATATLKGRYGNGVDDMEKFHKAMAAEFDKSKKEAAAIKKSWESLIRTQFKAAMEALRRVNEGLLDGAEASIKKLQSDIVIDKNKAETVEKDVQKKKDKDARDAQDRLELEQKKTQMRATVETYFNDRVDSLRRQFEDDLRRLYQMALKMTQDRVDEGRRTLTREITTVTENWKSIHRAVDALSRVDEEDTMELQSLDQGIERDKDTILMDTNGILYRISTEYSEMIEQWNTDAQSRFDTQILSNTYLIKENLDLTKDSGILFASIKTALERIRKTLVEDLTKERKEIIGDVDLAVKAAHDNLQTELSPVNRAIKELKETVTKREKAISDAKKKVEQDERERLKKEEKEKKEQAARAERAQKEADARSLKERQFEYQKEKDKRDREERAAKAAQTAKDGQHAPSSYQPRRLPPLVRPPQPPKSDD